MLPERLSRKCQAGIILVLAFVFMAGLNGVSQSVLASMNEAIRNEPAQAGFYTPKEKGKMWDTWAYYHEGTYYLYYLAGAPWSRHDLATSKDGVHWKEYGTMVTGRKGTKWTGTGHIWKAPDFEKSHRWVSNYSEWFGDKQDIMFSTSTDLVNWTKVDEKLRFVQDTRWYKEKGRWDCIDTAKRPDGSLYGYFTADPAPEKVNYKPCGFGFAQSKDGIKWEALPPVEGDITGEFGGIQKFDDKYYILISEGRLAVGDKPEGPFWTQKKNPNAFGTGCDIYFPRFFHTAPGGPLVNHFYRVKPVYAAPFKDVDIDAEGVLRLKWWKGNNKLKSKKIKLKIAPKQGYAESILMHDKKLDLAKAVVIEGTVNLPKEKGSGFPGIFFDHGDGRGECVLFTSESTKFGTMKSNGGDLAVSQTISRDMNFGNNLRFRVVAKHNMMEVYINDYLMTLKTIKCNGQIGFTRGGDKNTFGRINAWQSK